MTNDSLAKGQLETLVKRITDAYIVGTITPPAGKLLTPNYIRRIVEADIALGGGENGTIDLTVEIDMDRGKQIVDMAFGEWSPGDDDRKISAGPVNSMLLRWAEYGFAVINPKPVAFTEYTDAAAIVGLIKLKERFREQAKAARKAAKATEEPEPEPEQEPEQELPAATIAERIEPEPQELPAAIAEQIDLGAEPVESASRRPRAYSPNEPETDPALEPPAQYTEREAPAAPQVVIRASEVAEPVEAGDGLAGLAGSANATDQAVEVEPADGLPGVSGSSPFGKYAG